MTPAKSQTAPPNLLAGEAIPGLVWAACFDDEGRGRFVEGADIAAALSATEGWVWIHVNGSDLRGRAWIETTDLIADEVRALMLEDDDHLSLTAEDATLMGIFADFRRDFDHGTHDLARLRFALKGRLLLTSRRHALHAVEEVRQNVLKGRDYASGALLLEAVFETFVAQVAAMTRELGKQLEVFEDRIVEDQVDEADIRIGPARRTSLRLSRQLSALRLHFSAFVDGENREVPDDVFDMAERVSLRLRAAGREIEAIQERSRILQEELSTKLANAANRQLYAISVMTALFLPATLVTGMFGMNTHGLPFDSSDIGFWQACGVGLAGSGLVYFILRRMGVTK